MAGVQVRDALAEEANDTAVITENVTLNVEWQ